MRKSNITFPHLHQWSEHLNTIFSKTYQFAIHFLSTTFLLKTMTIIFYNKSTLTFAENALERIFFFIKYIFSSLSSSRSPAWPDCNFCFFKISTCAVGGRNSLFIYLYFYIIQFHFDRFWVSGFGIHLVRTQKISKHLTLLLISRWRTNRRNDVN